MALKIVLLDLKNMALFHKIETKSLICYLALVNYSENQITNTSTQNAIDESLKIVLQLIRLSEGI